MLFSVLSSAGGTAPCVRLAPWCNPGLWWRPAAGSRWLLAKQRQPRTPAAQPAEAPPRPALQEVSQCMLLEREVEVQYRARMRKALQDKVNAAADSLLSQSPTCARCSQPMQRHDSETVSWVARFGRLHATVTRYRYPACKDERRPLLDLLGVEPGRISGSLARLWALLAVGAHAGGAMGLVAVGRQNQPHEGLEGSPAIGRVGRRL